MPENEKSIYVCGPLTDIPSAKKREEAKKLYNAIGHLCEKLKKPVFVPHWRFDPVEHASFTPEEVNKAEKEQICHRTSLLIVIALAPSWGGGIEVGWADEKGIPGLLLLPEGLKVSRLLQGNNVFVRTVEFGTEEEALAAIEDMLLHSPLFVEEGRWKGHQGHI